MGKNLGVDLAEAHLSHEMTFLGRIKPRHSSTHNTHHDIMSRTIQAMTFFDGQNGEFAPLPKCACPATLRLRRQRTLARILRERTRTKSKTLHISSILFCIKVPVRAKQAEHCIFFITNVLLARGSFKR